LFYFDFAFGAIAAAAVLAWTAGTLGSELSFADRIAVAGLRSQALAIGGGFIFSLGNMLLLASVSLLGMAAAFPVTFALALVVWSLAALGGVSYPLLALGDVLLLGAVATGILSRKEALKKQPLRPGQRPNAPAKMQRRTKGIITALIGGVLIGASYPIAENGFWGDLGLGAYAGLLLFTVGMLISTVIFGFFFLNIAIEGGRLTPRAYFAGGLSMHVLGLLGGALWSGGMGAWLLARSAPAGVAPSYSQSVWTLGGSALLALLWGLLAYREFKGRTSSSNGMIGATVVLYAAGLAALSLRML
jgi:glucose uptake protein